MSSDTPKARYLSIRWRISLVIAALVAGFSVIVYAIASHQFHAYSESVFASKQRTNEQIIEGVYRNRVQSTIDSLSNIITQANYRDAISKRDTKYLAEKLENYRDTLLFDAAIMRIGVYGIDSALIMSWPAEPTTALSASLLQHVIATDITLPRSAIDCDRQCYITIYLPVRGAEKQIAAMLLAQVEIGALLSDFAEMTNQPLRYVNSEEALPPTRDSQLMYLSPKLPGTRAQTFVLEYDHANEERFIAEMKLQYLVTAGIIILLVVLTVLGMLWKPLIRIRQIAHNLPNIARGEAFNKDDHLSNSHYCDEIDVLWHAQSELSESIQHARKMEAMAKDAELRHQMADMRSRAQMDVFSLVSHDLKTPLNSIVVLASLLDGQNPSQQTYKKQIQSSAQYLLLLIQDILDTAKLEAGKLVIHCNEFSLSELLAETEDILTGQIDSKRIALKIRAHTSHDRYIGDSLRIKQVLLNLLSNSIKYTDVGEVSLGVTSLSDDTHRETLTFDIADTGTGLPEDIIAYYSDSNTDIMAGIHDPMRNPMGTGYGIRITKRLIELMGGTLHASVPASSNQGTKITVMLPLSPLENAVETTVGVASTVFHPLRILIADDDEITTFVLKEVLKQHGHAVDSVSDGEAMIHRLKDDSDYDLLIVDYRMPRMNGIEVAKHVRGSEAWRAIPIILSSAELDEKSREPSTMALFTTVMIKPIDPAKLVEWVNRRASVPVSPMP